MGTRAGFLAVSLLLWALVVAETIGAKPQSRLCPSRSVCGARLITCPSECPRAKPSDPAAKKGCYLDCNSPKCEAFCRNRKPNCDAPGAACFDPRFIGGDGIVFYFHGKRNEHFSLVSDSNLQINAHFIGLRPVERARDYTWIQALGLMTGNHRFTVQAKETEKWDEEVDHLQFSHNGDDLSLFESYLSEWRSPDSNLVVERTATRNSVTIMLPEVAEISVNVVPVTEEENRVHNYKIPSNNCFAHLEVQFRFLGLSNEVEGVIGRTYRPDFENPAKKGVAMPVVGGEDKYRTTSLLSADCGSCKFSPAKTVEAAGSSLVMDFDTLNCSSRFGGGYGLVCKR